MTHRFDPEKYWKTADNAHIRPVPIGVAEDGTPVQLDINEAARNGMGPHGLCVGATGSGKSELLRTLALGMITSHPPDVLNLILVDFKGGATFLGLERARHVGAVITNLADEAHLVSRMNDALAGEMNRRQELLRAAGGFANLAEYRRAGSRGAELPPMPTLFILVDEFSELLSQHPDFAELFVAIGRLGRSLGMHLLLASQRLDEGRLRGLETHLSYRICLKTFSAGESRAVLGVPDAYHLPSTPGAAYLKSASGELVRFQTAFVSGADSERRGARCRRQRRSRGCSPPHRWERSASGRYRRLRSAGSHRVGRGAGPPGGSRPIRASGVAAAVDRFADARHADAGARGSGADGADRSGGQSVRAAPRSAHRRIGRAGRKCRDRRRTAVREVDSVAHDAAGAGGNP